MRRSTALLATVAAVLLCAPACEGAKKRDLYRELNVTSDATTKEIRKSYQKWSRMLHPDVTTWNKEEAKLRMIDITEAYEVLVDEDRRETYDKTGKLDIGTAANTDELRAQLFKGNHDSFIFKTADEFNAKKDANERWLIFFWHKGYPECLPAAAIWDKFASRMKGVTNIGVLSCESTNMMLCRSLRMNTLPTVVFLKDGEATIYDGKIESQSLVDFAATNMLSHADETIQTFTPGMFAFSSEVAPVLSSSNFLAPQVRHSTVASAEVWELLTFEYTDCMDCRIELRMAVEALHKSSPKKIKVVRTDCSLEANHNYCKLAPYVIVFFCVFVFLEFCFRVDCVAHGNSQHRSEGHSWRVAHGRRTTHYAPSTDGWQRIRTGPLSLEFFEHKGRKWTARQITNFVFRLQKSSIIRVSPKTLHDTAFKEATAWAVCYCTHTHRVSHPSLAPTQVMFTSRSGKNCRECHDLRADWEIMARITKGYLSAKGTKLKVAEVDCDQHQAYCSSLGLGGQLPAARMWRGGIKEKKAKPHVLSWRDPTSMLVECKREMEPLQIHKLDKRSFNELVLDKNGKATKPNNWLLIFSAGSWCPPCQKIKGAIKMAARILEDSRIGAKVCFAPSVLFCFVVAHHSQKFTRSRPTDQDR